MNFRNDPAFLKEYQYKTEGNLNARIRLHTLFSTNPLGWANFVKGILGKIPASSLLEVGCGSAHAWQATQPSDFSHKKIFLTDFSFGMARSASHSLHEHKVFHFANLDAQFLPFKDQSFDIVIANHMLYHVPDIDLALTEIHRVLSPNGSLVAATNGAKHLIELTNFVRQAAPDLEETGSISSKFSLENGASYLERHFGQVTCHLYPDSLDISEVGPLLDYILSMWGGFITESQRKTLKDGLDQRFARDKHITVQKSTGLFVSKKESSRS
jgi:SAM-dependent methyltransferase